MEYDIKCIYTIINSQLNEAPTNDIDNIVYFTYQLCSKGY